MRVTANLILNHKCEFDRFDKFMVALRTDGKKLQFLKTHYNGCDFEAENEMVVFQRLKALQEQFPDVLLVIQNVLNPTTKDTAKPMETSSPGQKGGRTQILRQMVEELELEA